MSRCGAHPSSVATHSVVTSAVSAAAAGSVVDAASRTALNSAAEAPVAASLEFAVTGIELAVVALGADPIELGRRHVPVAEAALASRRQAVVRAVPGNMFELLSVGKGPTHITRHKGAEVVEVQANHSAVLYDGDQIGLSQHDTAQRHCTFHCHRQIVTAELHVICSGKRFPVAMGTAAVELGRKQVQAQEEILTSRRQAVVRAVPGNMFELLSVGKGPTHITRHDGGTSVVQVHTNSSTVLCDGDTIGLSQLDIAKRHCSFHCVTSAAELSTGTAVELSTGTAAELSTGTAAELSTGTAAELSTVFVHPPPLEHKPPTHQLDAATVHQLLKTEDPADEPLSEQQRPQCRGAHNPAAPWRVRRLGKTKLPASKRRKRAAAAIQPTPQRSQEPQQAVTQRISEQDLDILQKHQSMPQPVSTAAAEDVCEPEFRVQQLRVGGAALPSIKATHQQTEPLSVDPKTDPVWYRDRPLGGNDLLSAESLGLPTANGRGLDCALVLVFALRLHVVDDELQSLVGLLHGLRYRGTVAIVVCTAADCWVHTQWTELPIIDLQSQLGCLWRSCTNEVPEHALVTGIQKALELLRTHVLVPHQHSRVAVVRRPDILLIDEESESVWASIIQRMAAEQVLLLFLHQRITSQEPSQESQVASEEIYVELTQLPDVASVLVDFREDRHDFSCLNFEPSATDYKPQEFEVKSYSKHVTQLPAPTTALHALKAAEVRFYLLRHVADPPEMETVVSIEQLWENSDAIQAAFITGFECDLGWVALELLKNVPNVPVTVACDAKHVVSSNEVIRDVIKGMMTPQTGNAAPPKHRILELHQLLPCNADVTVIFPKMLPPTFGKQENGGGKHVGCFHPKMMLLYFASHLRVVISSANLHSGHWTSTERAQCCNAVWYADFPRRKHPDLGQLLDKDKFGGALADFVARLTLTSHRDGRDIDLEGQSRWQDDLAEYDFSGVPEGIRLVATVPEYSLESNSRRLHDASLGFMQCCLFEGSLSGLSRLQLLDEDDETPALLHSYTDKGARVSVKVNSGAGYWTVGWLHQSQATALQSLVECGAIMPVKHATARYRNASKGIGEDVNFIAIDVCFELIKGERFSEHAQHPLWRAIRNKLVCSYGLHRLKQVMQAHEWVDNEQSTFCHIAPCLGMDHSWLGAWCEAANGQGFVASSMTKKQLQSLDDNEPSAEAEAAEEACHFRFACKEYAFQTTEHQSHCSACMCWVCDCLVDKCLSWPAHQHAIDTGPSAKSWKTARKKQLAGAKPNIKERRVQFALRRGLAGMGVWMMPHNLISACGVGFDGSHMSVALRIYEAGMLRKCQSAYSHRDIPELEFLRGNHSKMCFRKFQNCNGVEYGFCYMGSHNLSGAAWGSPDRLGRLRAVNTEIGLLLWWGAGEMKSFKCPLPVDPSVQTPWDEADWKETMLHACTTIVHSVYSHDSPKWRATDVRIVRFVLLALLVHRASYDAGHAAMLVTQLVKDRLTALTLYFIEQAVVDSEALMAATSYFDQCGKALQLNQIRIADASSLLEMLGLTKANFLTRTDLETVVGNCGVNAIYA